MQPKDFQAFYWAGIAVLAVKFGIKIERLSMGDDYGLNGEAVLEPVEQWCDLGDEYSTYETMQVENYVTTLLAGSAASYICVRDAQCSYKRSFSDAGLEMKFLREVWQCLQREPDRAIAIICGSLGKRDDGDIEATMQRLWRRAAQLLQVPQQREPLRCLASLLTNSLRLEGHQILRLLRPK